MINSNALISIIIPVYGVEKYVGKCLSSIIAQSFDKYEAIIVDDGSIDQSIAIAKKTVGNDSRFIFLSKANGGQASARNLGLRHAQGDYIVFLDSDDYIEPTFLEKMYNKIRQDNSDICICNINYVDKFGITIKEFKNSIDLYLINNDFLQSELYISNFMWDKIFKSSLFNNLRFNEDMKSNEDVLLVFQLLYKSKLSYVDCYLYNYLQRDGSVSKSLNDRYIEDRCIIRDTQIKFCKQNNLFDKYSDYINYTYLKTFVYYSSIIIARYSKEYNKDISILHDSIDNTIFSYGKISKIIKKSKKVCFSLLLFKLNKNIFKILIIIKDLTRR